MKQQKTFPFYSGLMREEARERAQDLATEADQACIIYREGQETFGIELSPKVLDKQFGASVECRWPKEE